MKLSDFDFDLPKELIAQYPLAKRDESRLLVLDRKDKTVTHKKFYQIAEYLKPDDLLILNNTKVLPARVFGIREKTGARIEFLLISRQGDIFSVMVRPSKRFEQNEVIVFSNNNGGIRAKIIDKDKLMFDSKDVNKIYGQGMMPIPPYIKRKSEDSDFERYQTVFAEKDGSIAAPTAGLHFTKELLSRIKDSGVSVGYLTLHVGTGTFKPVKAEDVQGHKMDPEYFEVENGIKERISQTKKAGGRIFAVGTTSCRVVEAISDSLATCDSLLATQKSHTSLFIYPGYQFKLVDCLLTNFHLPKSTLFMLVCAFCQREKGGIELAKAAYSEAIRGKYRFYSYGDAMLIL